MARKKNESKQAKRSKKIVSTQQDSKIQHTARKTVIGSMKNSWSAMWTLSLYKPILGDILFLVFLGLVGGAITDKITDALTVAGANISRAQVGALAFVIPQDQQGILWGAFGLQVAYFITAYIVFSFFCGFGWSWADKNLLFGGFLRRFFALNAMLLPLYIALEIVSFYLTYQKELGQSAGVWLAVFWAGWIFLSLISVIATVNLSKMSAWPSLKGALQRLSDLKVVLPAFLMAFAGLAVIEFILEIILPLSKTAGTLIGVILLFPYFAYLRLFAHEVLE